MAFWIIHSLHRRFVSCELFVQNRYDIIAFWLQWMENVRTSYVGCRPVCQRLGYTITCSMSPFWLCGVCAPLRFAPSINNDLFKYQNGNLNYRFGRPTLLFHRLKHETFVSWWNFLSTLMLWSIKCSWMFVSYFLLPTYVTLYALEAKIPWIR